MSGILDPVDRFLRGIVSGVAATAPAAAPALPPRPQSQLPPAPTALPQLPAGSSAPAQMGFEAEQERARLEQAQLEEERAAAAKQQAELDTFDAQAAAAREAAMAQVAERRKAVEAATEAQRGRAIDPNHWMTSKSTAQQVLSIIHYALMGLQDPARAADYMQREIDRDLQLQQEAIARGQTEVDGQRLLLADMREALGDEEAAREATRRTMLERGTRAVQMIQQQYASPQAAARSRAVLGELAGREQTRLEEQRRADEQMALQRSQLAVSQGSLALQRDELAARKDAAKSAATAEADRDTKLRTVAPGFIAGEGVDPKTVAELRSSVAAAQDVDALTERLLILHGQRGAEADAERESAMGELLVAIKEAGGLGTLDEGTTKVVEQIAGKKGREEFGRGGQESRAKLESLRRNNLRRVRTALERRAMLDPKQAAAFSFRGSVPAGATPLSEAPRAGRPARRIAAPLVDEDPIDARLRDDVRAGAGRALEGR